MKHLKTLLAGIAFLFITTGCNSSSSNTIVVGATPSPHSEILKSAAVQDYIKSQGYNLKVKVYQDYITPNKALNDGALDANYFQHFYYLNDEVENKGYNLTTACSVHFEPLALYSKAKISDFTNKKISIINDVSNCTRALELLKVNGLISSYDVSNFDASHLVYTSEIGVTLEAISEGLLTKKVDDDSLAVIPGNFALTSWGATKATSYKVFSESPETAGLNANLIAVRKDDLLNDKTRILVEALSRNEVKEFIENTYGPTVTYAFKDYRNN